jgi:hypothetical protein
MEKQNLKLIFSEIIEGYSLVNSPTFGDLKIKHINNFDSAQTDIKQDYYFKKAAKEGLPEREDKIKYLIEEKLWDPEKDKEADRIESLIKGMMKTKSKLHLQVQIDQIKKDIKAAEADLIKIKQKKEEIIGFTAEEYASRRVNEYLIQVSILNEDGKALFNDEEFGDLEQGQILEIMGIYSSNTDKFKAYNLKRIALADFFTNIFYICEDNIFNFYGKPVIHLTFYQIEVYSFGRYFKSIIQNSEEKIPEHIMEDPDELIEWAQSSKNVKEAMEKGNSSDKEHGATSLVGATKEDLKKAGIDEDADMIDLSQEAKKKGGKLSMEDMMKLHGVK